MNALDVTQMCMLNIRKTYFMKTVQRNKMASDNGDYKSAFRTITILVKGLTLQRVRQCTLELLLSKRALLYTFTTVSLT